MTVKDILKLLDPKNQNLPELKAGTDFGKGALVIIPVIQGEENKIKRFKNSKCSGKKDEVTEVVHEGRIIRLIGIGKRDQMTARVMRRFYGKAYLSSLASKPKKIAMACPMEWMTTAALGVRVAALDPAMLKPKWEKKTPPEVTLVDLKLKNPAKAMEEIRMGQVIAEGKNVMRILGAIPPNALNQQTYAELAVGLAKQLKVPFKRASQKELKKYELLQAVSLGSDMPSELLIFKWGPKTKEATALIGKGVCYDSGGLQGKQDHMKDMKADMSGSAAVLGTLVTLVKGKLPLKETTYFILPLAQNMMGSRAMRADDVWTAGDGQTVEIVHTDAEGRLILADAVCYVKNNFKEVRRYYTIATLTGSCIVALGDVYTGAICNNEKLAGEAVEAGKTTGDLLHAAPWDLEYDDYNVPTADMGNLGESTRDAGWIKGGLFMHRFIPKTKDGDDAAEFCHFDIAGSIDMSGKGKPWRRKGFSSGIGVSLFLKLLTR